MIGAFEIALGSVYATDTIAERFRTGGGYPWGDHDEHVLGGCERFFRPGYLNNLTSAWIPALDGVEAKLRGGAQVADVGCGHGASTLLLAEAYPASTVVGFDAHAGSIDAARKRAADAGLADRVRFEVASATTFDGEFDLVCFFDCLHDMGDPEGACAHVRDHLAPGGTLMLIEPFAHDNLADNLTPVGAAYYGFSTLLCTPSSLAQDVGTALGAQAGETRLRDIVTAAGFTNPATSSRNTLQHRAGGQSVMKVRRSSGSDHAGQPALWQSGRAQRQFSDARRLRGWVRARRRRHPAIPRRSDPVALTTAESQEDAGPDGHDGYDRNRLSSLRSLRASRKIPGSLVGKSWFVVPTLLAEADHAAPRAHPGAA